MTRPHLGTGVVGVLVEARQCPLAPVALPRLEAPGS